MNGPTESTDFKVIPAESYTPIPTILPIFIHLLMEQHLQNIYCSLNTL